MSWQQHPIAHSLVRLVFEAYDPATNESASPRDMQQAMDDGTGDTLLQYVLREAVEAGLEEASWAQARDALADRLRFAVDDLERIIAVLGGV